MGFPPRDAMDETVFDRLNVNSFPKWLGLHSVCMCSPSISAHDIKDVVSREVEDSGVSRAFSFSFCMMVCQPKMRGGRYG